MPSLLAPIQYPANPPLDEPTYSRDITLYSAVVLNNKAWFHKIKRGIKIYELRKMKLSVHRPYVVFHPNAHLQKAGFNEHLVAHIFNVKTTFDSPSGAMDFGLLCKHAHNGLDIGFDSPDELEKYMLENNMTHGYLYPIQHPREEEIIWTTNTKFTSLYNQVFLTGSYLLKQATPSNPHVWLFWFPESPPGLLSSFHICLLPNTQLPRRSNPSATTSSIIFCGPPPPYAGTI